MSIFDKLKKLRGVQVGPVGASWEGDESTRGHDRDDFRKLWLTLSEKLHEDCDRLTSLISEVQHRSLNDEPAFSYIDGGMDYSFYIPIGEQLNPTTNNFGKRSRVSCKQ